MAASTSSIFPGIFTAPFLLIFSLLLAVNLLRDNSELE
jgi:hypothetical protein